MEDIIKTITTRAGARVSLVQPQQGRPFFRYEAGANAVTDSFRYVIRQHGQEDTATVTVNVDVPVEEDTPRDYFNRQANGFIRCLEKAMDGSPATLALTNLLGIDEGEPLNDDWLDKVFHNFRHFDYAVEEGQPFNLKDHYGRYVYIASEGYFDIQKADDTLEIVFPSSPDVLENDTVFVIKEYQSTEVKLEKGLYHFPTHFHASLLIKDQPYFSLVLNGARSEADTEYHHPTGIPISFDVRLKVEPYNLDLLLQNQGGQEFFANVVLRDRDGCQINFRTNFGMYADLENVQPEQVNFYNASLMLNELEFVGLESLWYAAQTNPQTQEEVDSMIYISCNYQGRYIGKVRILVEEQTVVLEYEDGTSQDLGELVMKFLDEYYQNDKADGTPRNQAFNIGEDQSYRSLSGAPTLAGNAAKIGAKLAEGFRRRTSRGGTDMNKVAAVMESFFVKERKVSEPAYDHEADMKAQEEARERSLQEQKEAEERAQAEAEAQKLAEEQKQAEAAKADQARKAAEAAAAQKIREQKAREEAEKAARARELAEAAALKKRLDAEAVEAEKAKKLADEAAARKIAEAKALEEAEKKPEAEAPKSKARTGRRASGSRGRTTCGAG